MSRVSDLENKVDALERNVGLLAKEAGLDDCLMINDFSSISKYRDGIECGCDTIKNDKREELTMEEKLLYLLGFFIAEADDLPEDYGFYKEANKLFNRGDYDELVKLCLNKYK